MLPSYVVLDLETTGGRATGDCITEIAAVRFDNGIETRRWSSLVNPGTPIPYYIQNLTGINDAMVADAPRFKQVADTLLALLEGSVLVAHNVGFDHGFLRGEYARLGHELRVPSLCTVRLSRKLYPQFKSHGLDAIIQRHGLHTDARHRAMGDVDLVLTWLNQARAELGPRALQNAATELLQPPLGLPLQLETQVGDIPDSPGVYLFYGEAAAPLFIGSATNLRHRVTEHLQSASKLAPKSSKERGIVHNTQRIEWHPTAGEIGALLQARYWMDTLKPTYGQSAKPRVAVNVQALHPWPYPGLIGLREHDADTGRTEIHLFQRWCHIATVNDEQALADFAEQTSLPATHPLDMDVYRMLVKRFKGGATQATQLVPIPSAF